MNNDKIKDNRNPLEPYAYQHKEILRAIQKKYEGVERGTALKIYVAITWTWSDFSKPGNMPKNWIGIVASKCGSDRKTVSRYLKEFAQEGWIAINNLGEKGGKGWKTWILPDMNNKVLRQ
ncbi:MAG: hypothetical protein A3B17_03050 [Candidatus Yanofskybacteria bacterium RIFCSPLOWO2_01_FULL_45_72]|nr:MAG: hypothetical protein A3B17_03050 [Candidatus Yanofskybacteria bacterium RIFCSPLOWO2_01_FULL_45_72]